MRATDGLFQRYGSLPPAFIFSLHKVLFSSEGIFASCKSSFYSGVVWSDNAVKTSGSSDVVSGVKRLQITDLRNNESTREQKYHEKKKTGSCGNGFEPEAKTFPCRIRCGHGMRLSSLCFMFYWHAFIFYLFYTEVTTRKKRKQWRGIRAFAVSRSRCIFFLSSVLFSYTCHACHKENDDKKAYWIVSDHFLLLTFKCWRLRV